VGALTNELTQSGLSSDKAQMVAVASVYRSAQGQATTMAYIDVFWILAVAAAIMFGLSFLLKKNARNERAGGITE
jgi:hypothetical protein